MWDWKDLETLLKGLYGAEQEEPLLERDYHKLGTSLTSEHDKDALPLLEDANAHRKRVEVEQSLGRLRNKPCFLLDEEVRQEDGKYSPSLRAKFQLLARYYYATKNMTKFAEVLASSIVLEWLTTVRLSTTGVETNIDRQPLTVSFQGTGRNKKLPSFRLRMLALRQKDLANDFINYGKMCTWVVKKIGSDGWERVADAEIIEQLENVPDEPPSKRRSISVVESSQARPAYSCSFASSGNYFPHGRTKDSFIDTASGNVVFGLNNLELELDIEKGARYALESEVSLSVNFNDMLIHVEIAKETTTSGFFTQRLLQSMEFEIARYKCPYKNSFPLIWDILQSCYRRSSGEHDPDKQFLHWKDVSSFLEHFFDHRFNVEIRKLFNFEIRTIQQMMLSSRLFAAIAKFRTRGVSDLDDPANWKTRREIEQVVFQRTFGEEDESSNFIDRMKQKIRNESLPDSFKIYKSDFTSACVNLNKDETLDFSVYEWLNDVAETLGGSQFHSVSVQMTTLRLFNQGILTMHSSQSVEEKMLQVPNSSANNLLMVRFDECSSGGFVIHNRNIKESNVTFTRKSAAEISTRKMKISGCTTEDMDRAAQAGVLSANKREASGLYVFLLHCYHYQSPRIVRHVPSSSETVSPNVEAVDFINAGSEDSMYDFLLIEEPKEKDEVDPERGTSCAHPSSNPSSASAQDVPGSSRMDLPAIISTGSEDIYLRMPPSNIATQQEQEDQQLEVEE